MGCEIKRVPLDFDWPLDKVWAGYVMPDFGVRRCPDCRYDQADSSGYSPGAYAISRTFYPHMIASSDRQHAEHLAWHNKIGQAEVDNLVAEGGLRVFNPETRRWESRPRLASEVNAERHVHDAINRHILVKFRCETLGIQHLCSRCDGEGKLLTPEQRKAIDAWELTDPPSGDGWQVWETVSEGSPISPVGVSADALVDYLVAHGTVWDQRSGDGGWRRSAAEAFVLDGSAPTLMAMGGVVAEGGRDSDKMRRPS